MAVQTLVDRFSSTLAGSYTSGGGTLSVSADPSGVSGACNFLAIVKAEGANTEEVFLVTNVSSGTWTVTGAQAGSSASDHASGATVIAGIMSSSVINQLFSESSKVGAYSSIPAAATRKAGDRYKCNDSLYDLIFDGSNWVYFGFGLPVVVPTPVLGSATTLNGGINNSVTALTVNVDVTESVPFVVQIGTELVQVTAKTGTSWSTIVRGFNGSTAASHSNGDAVQVMNWFLPANSAGSRVSTSTAGGIISFAENAGTDNIIPYERVIPATPYFFEVGFTLAAVSTNYLGGGLVLRDDSNGKITRWTVLFNNTHIVYYDNWNSPTSGQSNALATAVAFSWGGPIWLRISDDGTTRLFQMSYDRITWITIKSEGHTNFITPTRIGFFAVVNNVSIGSVMNVFHNKIY